MNEEQRARIIAYNRKIKKYKEGYEGFLLLGKALDAFKSYLPSEVQALLAKYDI